MNMRMFEDVPTVDPPEKQPRRKKSVSKDAQRRYYLHRKIKPVMRVDVYNKTLFYNDGVLDGLTVNQLRYFLELQQKFNYVAQQELTE